MNRGYFIQLTSDEATLVARSSASMIMTQHVIRVEKEHGYLRYNLAIYNGRKLWR